MCRSLAIAMVVALLAGLVIAVAISPPPPQEPHAWANSLAEGIYRIGAGAVAFFLVFVVVLGVLAIPVRGSGAADTGAAAEKEWRCPKCGEVNRSELDLCQSCGGAPR